MTIWWQSDGSQCIQKVYRVTSQTEFNTKTFLDTDYKKKIKEVTQDGCQWFILG